MVSARLLRIVPPVPRLAAAVAGIVLWLAPDAWAQGAACGGAAPSDWMASSRRSSAPVRPTDCATVEQTPPDFSWPDHGPGARYEFRLTSPDGATRRRTTERNWIAWDEALAPGEYRWEVRLLPQSGQSVAGRVRRFVVSAGATPFVVPDWTVLLLRASSTPRPRALPRDRESFLAALAGDRREGLARLRAGVESKLAQPVPAEPAAHPKDRWWAEVHHECWRTQNAALAWLATGKEAYLVDALRRALNLASWDPRGSTAYANHDQASREIAWTLALAYDWLSARLDGGHKRRLLGSLTVRVGDMYDELVRGRARVAVHPRDSHGNHTLTLLAAISAVLAGDVAEANDWLRDALPLAVHWTSPWGGEDGGFANGTAYAQWTTGQSLIAWNILRWTVGVDLAQKAWVRNYARFIAYFLPPGTPAGAFGDGAELALHEEWARFGKAYTSFAPTPLGRWYASQLTGEDPMRPQLLLAPLGESRPAPYPRGTANAALFPSIGWAAMHSSLEDPARVSVYFKSSPYGSYNHSHADQNSFIVNVGGRRLAIDSGYYDGYKTPHWREWYKQTRAHNAITFDGGQGQVVFEDGGKLGPGAITGYDSTAGYDIASGDATAAYGGALKAAKRSLVYVRPHLILAHDMLASEQARQWEWNIHALHRMAVAGDRRVTIRNGEETLCVEMLAGPEVKFTQTDRFSAAPLGRNMPPQWHGAFVSRERSASTEFVALMRVGCTSDPVAVVPSPAGWRVELAGRTVTLAEGRAEVRPAPARR